MSDSETTKHSRVPDKATSANRKISNDDLTPTLSQSGKRRWLYPDRRSGRHSRLRGRLAVFLIAFYLAAPFLSIAGRPLVRIDVMEQRAYIAGLVMHVSDSAYLVFVPLSLAMALFLVTALRGRLWCGYACPQTVFVEWLIRPIEELIEGKAHHRRLADQGPWTVRRLGQKLLKHTLFLGIAAIVANTFLAYFIAPTTLLHWVTSSPAEHPQAFALMSFVLLLFYADLAWFREQFCAFVCPYARFQSVLMDSNTPAVTYDIARGEPRGRKPGAGHCIDCDLCVRVCPTGIDIRKGLQMECIACGRCADACDGIMSTLKRPPGLIGWKKPTPTPASRLTLRIRPLIYTLALILVFATAVWRITERPALELNLVRAPGVAQQLSLPDGRIGNVFSLRAVNNTDKSQPIVLEIVKPEGASIICAACGMPLAAFEDRQLTLIVAFPPKATPELEIRYEPNAASRQSLTAALLKP